MKSILVTGGAGFVGSNLSIALAKRHPDWRITAFDNLYRKGSELNLDRLADAGGEFIRGDVRALDDVGLSVSPGEVIGLVGENGAGKSTLMKILGGVAEPSAGTIVLDGEPLARLTVARSMAGGIAFVHQDLNLFENLTVGANIFIGREPLRGGLLRFVDDSELHRSAQPLLAQLGADFDATTPLATLSLAQAKLGEIPNTLSLKASRLIMEAHTSRFA